MSRQGFLYDCHNLDRTQMGDWSTTTCMYSVELRAEEKWDPGCDGCKNFGVIHDPEAPFIKKLEEEGKL